MQCPHCPDTALLMTDRQGIEIDYCPSCRGVWLDRGELDKLIERSMMANVPAAGAPAPRGHAQPHHDHWAGKRRKSWMAELFD